MKKPISLILAFIITLSMITFSHLTVSAGIKDSAPIGDGETDGVTGVCTWKIEDGVLTISGNGRMGSYDSSGENIAPWRNISVSKVVIENGVTTIGQNAFRDCYIRSVTIPNSVIGIASGAFRGCKWLSSIEIPDSVTIIGSMAFYDCSLKSITIPDSVTDIEFHAFEGCKNLKSVIIGNSVTDIKFAAFEGCTSLESVTIGNSVSYINDNAFDGCPLKSVNIHDVSAWCKIQFGSDGSGNPLCRAHNLYLEGELITDLVIPESVTSISKYAFNKCTCLKSVTIPASVNAISKNSFYGCKNLKSVYISDLTTWLNLVDYSYGELVHCQINMDHEYNLFLNDELVTELTIPNAIETIYLCTFYNVASLRSVKISDSVTSIGTSAFYKCVNLSSVDIPDSVTSIGVGAFEECENLKTVVIPASVTSIGDNAFGYYRDPDFGTEMKVSGFTICGYKDTAAEKYANDNGFAFVEIKDEIEIALGDVDGNGKVDISDATTLQKYLAEYELPNRELIKLCGDVDGNNKIDISDATTIQKYIAEYELPYPIGEPIE